MAQATTTVSTSATDLSKIWRKVQGDLYEGFQFLSEEYAQMDRVPKYSIDVSAREITVPVDLNEEIGVADIGEGGDEARASSVNVEEVTLSYILMNARFTASVTARILDQFHRAAEFKKQIVYQGMKKMQALARHWSDYFYGYGTAILALTDTDLTAGPDTLTLKNGLNDSTIGGADATSGAYIAKLFKVNEYVAVLDAGALVTGAIGKITAVVSQANPTIAVTWNGSPSITTNGLQIVLANSVENTTIDGTSYNRGLIGLLDGSKSASVHSLSNATVPNWDVAGSDATGGRLSPVRLKKAFDTIRNDGPWPADRIIMSQGVSRDLFALQSAALRFNDPFALELDGDIKSQGKQIFVTKRVPPGYCWVMSKKALNRLDVQPKPDTPTEWSGGQKMENKSGYIFVIDLVTQLVWRVRKSVYYFSGLQES